MDRNGIQIVIKPGIFSLAISATLGYIVGQTTVYVKEAKFIINENKNEETKN